MRLCLYFVVTVLVILSARPAQAQLAVTLVDPLTFGTFIIRDFNAASLVSVAADGTNTNNSNMIILTAGQRAQFSVTGGPASTAYTVTFDANTNATRTAGGMSGTFTMDTFNVFPAGLSTDGAGADTFYVGARASTVGDGTVFLDGGYDATYDFTVQF